MKKADSADPAKYLPELAKISYNGATGKIEFDDKGDRKDAEMTIFTMKDGKLEPIAIVKGGKTTTFDEFVKAAAPAPLRQRRQRRGTATAPAAKRRRSKRAARAGNGTLGSPFFCSVARCAHGHGERLSATRTIASIGDRGRSRDAWTSSCSSSSTA